MQKDKAISEMKCNPRNIRFEKLCKVLESLGFTFKGGKGSHRVYIKSGIPEIVNLQNVNGKAKPYQVKQVLRIITKYSLLGDNYNE